MPLTATQLDKRNLVYIYNIFDMHADDGDTIYILKVGRTANFPVRMRNEHKALKALNIDDVDISAEDVKQGEDSGFLSLVEFSKETTSQELDAWEEKIRNKISSQYGIGKTITKTTIKELFKFIANDDALDIILHQLGGATELIYCSETGFNRLARELDEPVSFEKFKEQMGWGPDDLN